MRPPGQFHSAMRSRARRTRRKPDSLFEVQNRSCCRTNPSSFISYFAIMKDDADHITMLPDKEVDNEERPALNLLLESKRLLRKIRMAKIVNRRTFLKTATATTAATYAV